LITYPATPAAIDHHARAVRACATKRRLIDEAARVRQMATNPATDAETIAAEVATRFAQVRDSGITDDVQSLTMSELLAITDDEPDWLIPDLLERRDRLILTGEEGLGKSYLLRQVAVMAAAGLHPFDETRHIKPVRTMIVDCENSWAQVRRKARGVVAFAKHHGSGDPGIVNILCSSRIDITRDRDLARIHYEMDAAQPELVVIGPLYRLTPRALQTDDEAAPVLAALDTIRDRGCALLIEAHAGHAVGKGGHRDLRPRGSSALLGWPEFGYGMRGVASGYADLIPWRGDRDERSWPDMLKHDQTHIRWIPRTNVTPMESWAT
jgi:RecA-family ATPase